MRKHPQQSAARVERFLKNELAPMLWAQHVDMRAEVARPCSGTEQIKVSAPSMAPVEPGFTWGPVWTDAWFRLTGVVPSAWGQGRVCARMDLGCEAIVYVDGVPRQGVDWAHQEYWLDDCDPGQRIEIMVKATGMNPHVSVDARPTEPPATPFAFRFAHLASVDELLHGLYYDMKLAWEVAREQPESSPRRGQLLYAVNEAVNAFDPEDRTTWERCRELIARVYDRPAVPSAHRLTAVGHAHIDTAWLWPLERTQQKCLHTFATATRLMELYPEYRFVCSQACQYQWIKELAPALYDRIRARWEAGQWEIVGSMWVEADCNIIGGESLVRQVLHGKRFWLAEFGYETRDLWLPDVFGYAASLPQILKKAGVDYFLTQKMSWNQTNKFPHHTFLWEGIDGTRIFTHFPPADTYNGAMSPRELAYNVSNFRENDRATRSLYVFGHGDGGGGPTVEMLEAARRLADTEGMPLVQQDTVANFFSQAEIDAKDPSVWVGELYLELHRGTLTTQAATKKGNRKSEFLLRDAEFVGCISPDGLSAYPQADLERAWKLVLTNQFHDIIPGSSVNEVYADAARDYREVASIGSRVVGNAVDALAAQIDTAGLCCPVLVLRNYDDRVWGEPVSVAIPPHASPATVVYGGSDPAPVQIVEVDGERRALFTEQTMDEGHGYAVYDLSEAPYTEVNTFVVTDRLLDNGLIRVELDANAMITRIYDRLQDRDIVPAGRRANELQLFEDRPLSWDAWDIDIYYQETGQVVTELDSVTVEEAGPVRGSIRIVRSFGASTIVQYVRLVKDRARIDFETEIDWHESHKMLKAAFPVDINAARATYEIQYGHVERPTHMNTSWDLARFEVAAQKWVDLSEADYGVALLNDGKYGHDTCGNTMRLTLLRSPKAPDPEADMGRHRFTYALLPHYSDLRRGGVIDQAYHLNAPPITRLLPAGQVGPLPREQVFFTIDREGVVIEAVKKAEDENAVIVRLYEAYNSRGLATLTTSLAVRRASVCDLLEREEYEVPVVDGRIRLNVKPFEIVTIKLQLA